MNDFLMLSALLLVGAWFHMLLYREAKAWAREFNRHWSESFVWVFACFPGGLFWAVLLGWGYAAIKLIYP